MATLTRGFSFIPQTKSEKYNLQLIDNEELERAWKNSRRQRLKVQEEKIWKEFCMEHDIVSNITDDDQYQFLEKLPEAYMNEMMQKDINDCNEKKNEAAVEQTEFPAQNEQGDGDSPRMVIQHTVTFADEAEDLDEDEEDIEFLRICDNNEQNESGNEDEFHKDADNLETVREVILQHTPSDPPDGKECVESVEDEEKTLSRQDSNLSFDVKNKNADLPTIAEYGVYCAKVKELRWKINEALLDFINLLENQDMSKIHTEDAHKMRKRGMEFSTRFNRVYMYSLNRQMSEIKRHIVQGLPYAKHTQYQAQMVRVHSLHQNLLQAVLVYHKSFEHALLLHDNMQQLRALLGVLRRAAELCAAVPAPAAPPAPAERGLYDDDIRNTSYKFDVALCNYDKQVAEAVANDTASSMKASSSRSSAKTSTATLRNVTSSTKFTSKNVKVAGKLSMYSVEKHRMNLNAKRSKSTAAPRPRAPPAPAPPAPARPPRAPRAAPPSMKMLRKTPRSPRHRHERDHDLHTAVENILQTDCMSMHSRDQSPRPIYQSFRRASPTATPRPERCARARSPAAPRAPPRAAPPAAPRPELALAVEDFKADNTTGECEVTQLLRRLCGGDAATPRNERASGARNAQLLCISTGSPRQPTTPQLLKILEETIKKKTPSQLTSAKKDIFSDTFINDRDKFLLTFNLPQQSYDKFQKYRTVFVQHMLTNAMYANGQINRPWDVVGRLSDCIIDDLLANCTKEVQLRDTLRQMYHQETHIN